MTPELVQWKDQKKTEGIQKELNRIYELAEENLMEINEEKFEHM